MAVHFQAHRDTGVGLQSFAAKGGNFIRLLAGAFDPLENQLPARSGIPLRSEASLAPDAPQYWLVQVRDRRYADVVNANARWVNDTGVRDLYAATAPLRLNGAGQTAAVADTALPARALAACDGR